MRVSLNILLGSIEDFQHELHIDQASSRSFEKVSPLPKGGTLSEDTLYVCRLSEAMNRQDNGKYVFFCLRDRVQDMYEADCTLSGMVIINENISFETLFITVQDEFFRVIHWDDKMRDAVYSGSGIQMILDLSSDILGNYVAVSDSALKLIAYTKDIECDDPICIAAREHGFHPQSTVDLWNRRKVFERWQTSDYYCYHDPEVTDYPTVGKIFKFKNNYHTHCVMTCNNRTPEPAVIDLYNIMLEYIGMCVARDWEKEDVFHQVYHSFFVDLIENVLTDPEQIIIRAKHLNVPFRKNFRMIVIPLNNSGSYSAGRLGAELIEKFSHGKIILYHQQIILLEILYEEYMQEQMEEHKKMMNDFLMSYDLSCGISAVFSELTSMHTAYEQCLAALRYSSQVNEGKYFESPISFEDQRRGDKQLIFDFDDMILYCMLDASPENVKLWRKSRYSKALYSLHEQDRIHGTNNLQLLYIWLSCERRIALTSEIMHMHRNSVAYRIDKIEDLIGIDLNIHHERLKLMLSFSLMRLSSGN